MRAPMGPAGWWSRAAAYLIDIVCACMVGVAAYLMVAAFTTGVHLEATGDKGSVPEWAVIAFLTAIVNYSPLLAARRGKRSGQTIGRQVVGIRAVRADGRRLSFRHALRRHLAHVVITCIPVVGQLNYLRPLWDRRKQTLHDKLGGTLMVDAAYVPADNGLVAVLAAPPTREPAGSVAPPREPAMPGTDVASG
jgi:uncharacterized RDD family membrane protein YckC